MSTNTEVFWIKLKKVVNVAVIVAFFIWKTKELICQKNRHKPKEIELNNL
jgi:hypothetical protein